MYISFRDRQSELHDQNSKGYHSTEVDEFLKEHRWNI